MARLTRSRPLQIGAISAHGDELLAVDELLPIAVVFSAAGDVQAAHTWELSPTERAGNRVNSVLLTTEEILIISPAAGGVVRIDRRSGVSDTIALDPPPWFIVAAGDTVWLGDSAYDGYYLNEPTPTPPHTVSYPVIWEEDVEVEKDPARQFPEWGPWPRLVKKKGPRPSDSIGRQAVLEVSSPGHLWRLRGDRAEPVDLGGVVGTAYGSPHGLLLTCRTPDDPMIRERSHGPEGGARHVARSESVLLVQHDGTFEVIAKVRSVDRFVPAGNGCALFAGFETEDKTLRLLDFDHRASASRCRTSGRRTPTPNSLTATAWCRSITEPRRSA
jgi:hypothetical protein